MPRFPFLAALCVLLLAAGCDTPTVEAPVLSGAMVVDPGRLAIGDTVGTFHVDALYAIPENDSVWYGEGRFVGHIMLNGRYFDFQPNGIGDEDPRPCFEVDDADRHRLPRFPGDDRDTWFCFDDPALAIGTLGTPTSGGRHKSVVISRYYYIFEPSDVVNRATLASDEKDEGGVTPVATP